MRHRDPKHKVAAIYVQEAEKWIRFFHREDAIPGVHVPFTADAIERYLFYRARFTKVTAQVVSRLKWMGVVYNHVLPNEKHQQPSILFQRVRDAQRRVNMWIRADRSVVPNRALALDNSGAVVILSHHRCFSLRNLARLPWLDIMFAVQTVLCHSGCMRYGHFDAQDLLRNQLTRAPLAKLWKLESPWSKYYDGRPVSLFFDDIPRAMPARYPLMVPTGHPPVCLTASMMLQWYCTIRDRRFPDSPLLFPGMPANRRQAFTKWLRRTILAAVPTFANIASVRPHGLRAGWVCDRRAENVPDQVTMREGRWRSRTAMNVYDRACFRVMCPVSRIKYRQ